MSFKMSGAMGCAVSAVIGLAVNPQLAAEEVSEDSLDVIHIIPQEMDEVRTISVIDQEHIDNVQAANLGDVFRVDPEISVGGGGISAAQKIYVRGLEDTMLNVQIDGAPQTGQLYHHQTRLLLDPEFIKRVEVDSGSGPATAGPGALGGAVRFETKTASDLLDVGETVGSKVKAGYFSNGGGYKLTASGYGSVSEGLNVLAVVSYYDSDNYEDGGGNEIPDTEVEQSSALIKLDGSFDGGHSYVLGFDFYQDDGPRRIRANFVGPLTHPVLPNANVDRVSERLTISGTYKYQPEGSDLVDFKATVYTTDNSSNQESQERFTSGPPFNQDEYFEYDLETMNYGFDVRNTSIFDKGGRHTVTYGVDYRYDEVEFTNRTDSGSGAPYAFANWDSGDENSTVYGIFVQDNWLPQERVTVSYGLRWDHYSYDYEDPSGGRGDISDSGISPNAGVAFKANEAIEVYTNYSTAFRGMTTGEALFISHSSKTVNDDADAETAQNIEFGVRYSTENWKVNAEVFQQDIEDYIGNPERDNLGDVEIPGYSLSVGYTLDTLKITAGVNHSEPEMDGEALVNENNIGLGASSGRTWIFGVDYEFAERGLTIGWSARGVERLEDLPDDRPDKPGFGVHDIYASWTPPQHEQLNVRVTIKNVLDKEYMEHTSYGFNTNTSEIEGLQEPGRDVRLSVLYTF